MELLPKETQKILKSLKNKDILEDDILQKYGDAPKKRLADLKANEYIIISSNTDRWGKPTEPVRYSITEKGICYLEDYRNYVRDERRAALCRSVIAPIIVSVAASLLINGISLWLQWLR